MGTIFFWFYDVLLAAVLIGMLFLGVKRGFIRMLLSLIALAAAFIASLYISDGLSTLIYDKFVTEPLENTITDTVNDAFGDNFVVQIGKIDMSKATVGGKPIDQLKLTPDAAGKITITLDDVDMTKTGLSNVDLSMLGFDTSQNLSNLDIGTVQILQSDLKDNNIEDLVMAEVVSAKIKDSEMFDDISKIVDDINEALPVDVVSAKSLQQMDNTMIRDVVISIANANGNPGKSILDGVIKPMLLVPIRTLIFVLLFVIIMIVLTLIIKGTSIINKLPLIGKFNEVLGGVMGILEGVIVIFIIVIALHLTVTLTDNSLVFLNEMTINESYAFSWVYNFRFLDFLA